MDHDVLAPLSAPLKVPGLGPAKTAAFIKLVGGPAVHDMLFHAPTGVIDRSRQCPVAEAPEGEIATLRVTVEAHAASSNPRRPYRVRTADETGFLTLAWFHARPDYLRRMLPEGEERLVSGKIERFGSETQMLHPDYILPPEKADDLPTFEPVYPLTSGISGRLVQRAAAEALAHTPDLEEWLDPPLLEREGWPSWSTAMRALHAPQTPDDLSALSPARARLAYDELLADQLTLALVRARRKTKPGRALKGDNAKVKQVLAAAPFEPTGAQKRAARAIFDDMAAPERMGRLLQGDVGAGKTFVAALALTKAVEAGVQAVLMAPTEILARQHLANLQPLLFAAGIRSAALTGRDKGKPRRALLAAIAAGEVDVVVGTHALFQDDVTFQDLGFVVIDEQHRFGVSDRLKLAAKGETADVLVMTATPIPRTLTLAAFGDLDVSRLDEKPPGRTPVDTRIISLDRLEDIIEAIGRALDQGERVYWVCPLAEDSDASDLAAADERWRTLAALYGEARVGLVTGRMSAAEKDARAQAFKRGEMDVLVATTVIEVGVDAPDATVMIIEHAERFGLAQLHQLRGRVGRGSKASRCLLLYRPPLSETGRTRLEVMRSTEDGFVIAEEDWRLRGPGEVLGARQSGLPKFRLADIAKHGELLEMAAQDARATIARDPDLTSPRGRLLRVLLRLFDRASAVALLRAG